MTMPKPDIRKSDFSKLIESIRHHGLLATFRDGWAALRYRIHIRPDQKFDEDYKVDTCGVSHLKTLSISSQNAEHGVEYDPSPVKLIRWMFKQLSEIKDLKKFSFVDFGSGKGRVLILASEHPFSRIIGVEFASELHEIAVHNLKKRNSKHHDSQTLESIHVDAAEFEIPQGPCMLFFYVPFHPPVMSKVIENIEASHVANPREIIIVYAKPWFRELLDNQPWIEEVCTLKRWSMKFSPDPINIIVYQTTGRR